VRLELLHVGELHGLQKELLGAIFQAPETISSPFFSTENKQDLLRL
jgi:hypothetical protein